MVMNIHASFKSDWSRVFELIKFFQQVEHKHTFKSNVKSSVVNFNEIKFHQLFEWGVNFCSSSKGAKVLKMATM